MPPPLAERIVETTAFGSVIGLGHSLSISAEQVGSVTTQLGSGDAVSAWAYKPALKISRPKANRAKRFIELPPDEGPKTYSSNLPPAILLPPCGLAGQLYPFVLSPLADPIRATTIVVARVCSFKESFYSCWRRPWLRLPTRHA